MGLPNGEAGKPPKALMTDVGRGVRWQYGAAAKVRDQRNEEALDLVVLLVVGQEARRLDERVLALRTPLGQRHQRVELCLKAVDVALPLPASRPSRCGTAASSS